MSSGLRFPAPASGDDGEPLSLKDHERSHIISVLHRTGWRIEGTRGAAHILNVAPSTLRSRMKKLGIRRNPIQR
jgi:transcriptional regulator with GAF, ATPase, and Fis domain